MSSIRYATCTLLLCATTLISWTADAQSNGAQAGTLYAGHHRPLSVNDVLRTKVFDTATLSADGALAAIVIRRGLDSAMVTWRQGSVATSAAGDIWVVPTAGGAPRNITRGAVRRIAAGAPAWSATGTYLAFLEADSTARVSLWVWDRRHNSKREISGAVDIHGAVRTSAAWGYHFAWLSDSEVIWVEDPPEVTSAYIENGQYRREIVQDRWRVARVDSGSSASVLEGGVVAPVLPQIGHLMIAPVRDGRPRVVSEVPVGVGIGIQHDVLVSPDRTMAALCVTDSLPPSPVKAHLLTEAYFDEGHDRIGVVPLDGIKRPRWFGLPPAVRLQRCSRAQLAWSTTGAALGVRVTLDGEPQTSGAVVLPISESTARVVSSADQNVESIEWIAPSQLLIGSSAVGDSAAEQRRPSVYSIIDLADSSHQHRILDSSVITTARALGWSANVKRRPADDTVIGMLTKGWKLAGERVPMAGSARDTWYLTKQSPGLSLRAIVDEAGGVQEDSIPVPSGIGSLRALNAVHGVAVIELTDSTGASATWAVDLASHRCVRLMSINESLAQVVVGGRRLLKYASTEGDSLLALALLPPAYDSARRYPTIVWAYGGYVQGPNVESEGWGKSSRSPLNLDLLAAPGYVVLIPSLPMPAYGRGSDPFLDVAHGLYGAVDRAVAVGLSDPTRIGIMGHSFGGFSTLAIIAQTNRFRAAIELSGPSDFLSNYGTMDAHGRYSENDPFWDAESPWWHEAWQFRMGEPPTANAWRYLRNSPIMYADRIETPLLILQGDLDFVPIQQGEEVFTALYRLGKRVRFVRYWGEDHLVLAPGNVRDLWVQVYRWFDSYLGGASVTGGSSADRANAAPQ